MVIEEDIWKNSCFANVANMHVHESAWFLIVEWKDPENSEKFL